MPTLKSFAPILLVLGSMSCVASRAEAADCTVSTQSVALGNYDSLSPTPLDGVGNIAVSCSAPTNYTIGLGPGNGTIEQREMRSGVDVLRYNLYTDSTRTLVWGDGMGSGNTVSNLGQQASHAVYGRLPARQTVPAGSYVDTIVVTITY